MAKSPEELIREIREDTLPVPISLNMGDALILATAPTGLDANEVSEEQEDVYSLIETVADAIVQTARQNSDFPNGEIVAFVNGEAMDSFNKTMFAKIESFRGEGRYAFPTGLRDLPFNGINHTMRALITLNTAFINGGGRPRPEFIRFQQG